LVAVGLVHQERQATTLVCRADFAAMEATFALFANECCSEEPAYCQPSDPNQPCCE